MTTGSGERVFRYRLDIYWRALALYLLALLGYGLVRGGVANGYIAVVLSDPLVLLLLLFVFWTAGVLLWAWSRAPSIVVGDTYLRLRNRFGERLLRLEEIEQVRLPRRQQGWGRLIRIRLKGRRRVIVVRPAAYEHPQELFQEFVRLSRQLRTP